MNELPRGWVLATLGDVARWGSGGTPRAGDPRFYGGPIPWAVIGDLTDGPVSATAATITEEGLRQSSAKLVPPGAVLVAMYGSIGKLGFTTVAMATNQAIAFAIAHESVVEPRYLMHFLRHQRPRLAEAGKGATQRNIGQGTLKGWPIPVPPLDDQRRIVDILEDHLSRLDAASQGLRVAERKVRAWTISAIDAEVWASEPQMTREIRSLLGEKPRNGHSARASRTDHGIRALTLTAVTRRSFKDEFTKIVAADERRVRDLWLEPGDIFVQRSNTPELVGSVAMYSGRSGWAIFPDLLIRLRVDGNKAIPAYVEAAMRSERAHRSLRSQAKGLAGSMPKIDQAAITGLSIPVPPMGRQVEIAQRVAEIDDARTRIVAGIHRAAKRAGVLRRSLLDAAFSGRLTGASSDLDRVEELAGV